MRFRSDQPSHDPVDYLIVVDIMNWWINWISLDGITWKGLVPIAFGGGDDTL